MSRRVDRTSRKRAVAAMTVSRRHFLQTAGAAALGFAGLHRLVSPAAATAPRPGVEARFGPLVPDPDGLLDLPKGFDYRVLSRAGEEMDDGFLVPTRHDGMAAFPRPDGRTLLVRNHEVRPVDGPEDGPLGPRSERSGRLDSRLLYDPGRPGHGPAPGGTTTLLYDTRNGELMEHRLSLAGTLRNCAGGPTPWGSWISCEEIDRRADRRFARDHGYAFEVPAVLPPRGEALPLRAMGRFYREAVAVHPGTSIVYQTQDLEDGLLYRFVPDEPGRLDRGGRLQALEVIDRPCLRTQNWDGRRVIRPGQELPIRWIDLHTPENPDGDLRQRGHEAGAAQFARGEGAWYADGALFFACTNGGAAHQGQIWRYVPSPREGEPEEERNPGRLELFLEPTESSMLRRADNLTMAPWGDLVVCEDGGGVDGLVGVTPGGELYPLARNARSSGELAGSTFAPDGSTLFVNMQREGLTVAIAGPWKG